MCKTMAVQEQEGSVIFLYKIVSGAADRSYGIHVAELGKGHVLQKKKKTFFCD